MYSTCSLNPLENEAVAAEILRITEGAIEIVDVQDQLPELKRREGLQTWKIFDDNGEEMENSEFIPGRRITPTMFAPGEDEEEIKKQLARCIRVYPHLQDTGGFFITVLEKKSHLSGRKVDLPTPDHLDTTDPYASPSPSIANPSVIDSEPAIKRPKLDTSIPSFGPTVAKGQKQPVEEPFVFLPHDHPDLHNIRTFHAIDPSFPTNDLFVRNAKGDPLRAIYIVTPLVKELMTRNPTARILNAGTRLFVKQPDHKSDAGSFWRVHSDGLTLIDSFLGKDRVVTADVDEVWELLKSGPQFPPIRNLAPNLRDQVSGLRNGGFVIRVNPAKSGRTEIKVPFTMPMWKSPSAVK